MSDPIHGIPRRNHAFLYLFMLAIAVGFASVTVLQGANSGEGLSLRSIYALGSVAAAVGLIAAMWNQRRLLGATGVAVAGIGLAALCLMTITPRPDLEPILHTAGIWVAGPIPLQEGWADMAMALALTVCGAVLPLARAPNLFTQVISLTIIRAVLWGSAFWQLTYLILAGDFNGLLAQPACLLFQTVLIAAIGGSLALLLRGDLRWLATLTGSDNSIAISRYILPLALAPIFGAYTIEMGVKSRAYQADVALLFNVELLSVFLVLLGSVAIRTFWLRLEKDRELSRALQQSPVIIHSSDGRIEYWSRECENLFGFTADEALGCYTQTLLKTEYIHPLDEIIDELRTEGRWTGVVSQVTREGLKIRTASTVVIYCPNASDEVKVVATMSAIGAHD